MIAVRPTMNKVAIKLTVCQRRKPLCGRAGVCPAIGSALRARSSAAGCTSLKAASGSFETFLPTAPAVPTLSRRATGRRHGSAVTSDRQHSYRVTSPTTIVLKTVTDQARKGKWLVNHSQNDIGWPGPAAFAHPPPKPLAFTSKAI
jgi:hypothetical protein